jgi:hypothetical protein
VRDSTNQIDRLVADGLLRRDDAVLRTTRRWQAAMARAALRLLDAGAVDTDLRIPIASALLELYGDTLDNQAIVDLVGVMLPVEIAELSPGQT